MPRGKRSSNQISSAGRAQIKNIKERIRIRVWVLFDHITNIFLTFITYSLIFVLEWALSIIAQNTILRNLGDDATILMWTQWFNLFTAGITLITAISRAIFNFWGQLKLDIELAREA